MTPLGRTALSVEMQTKRSTPSAAAASTDVEGAEDVGGDGLQGVRFEQVARACGRRRGRRPRGWYRAKTSKTAARSVMSMRACSQGTGRNAAASWRWVSSWSRSTTSAGSKLATWREISEPMEPPAPVISTRLPASERRTASRSVATWVRPRRSSMRGSRAWPTLGGRPHAPDHLAHPGKDLHGHAGRLGGAQGALHQVAAGRRNGQEHLLDGVAAGGIGDVVDRAHDGHPEQRQAVGRGVVVEDGHRHEPGAAGCGACRAPPPPRRRGSR